jgi:hypothetical protein
MKNIRIFGLLSYLLLSSLFVASADAQEVLSAKQSTLVTVTAAIQTIDYETREVTLVGQLGNSISFVVDQRIRRLAEFSVNDEVVAKYYVSLAGELREPTPLERRTPLVVLEGAGTAPEGTSPAGGALRAFQVVATVIGLDLPTQSVNLQGPRGNTGIIVAQNLDNLKALSLGDTIILTYTEALAISLEKVE